MLTIMLLSSIPKAAMNFLLLACICFSLVISLVIHLEFPFL
jgi:hypothetical protein